jgi:hypothetical protein
MGVRSGRVGSVPIRNERLLGWAHMLAIREPPLRAPDLRAGAALVNAAAQHDSRVGYE